MDEEKSELLKQRVMSVIAGVAAGFVMATVLLLLVRNFSVFTTMTFAYFVIVVIGCFLPGCMDVLRRRGFYILIVEIVMIVTSGNVCVLYADTISRNDLARQNLLHAMIVLHVISFLFTIGRLWLINRREEKKQ